MALGVYFLLTVCGIHTASAMDCSLPIGSYRDFGKCPGLLDGSTESYCCWNPVQTSYSCCTFVGFLFNSAYLLLPILILALVIIMCCRCCRNI